jgi:transcriptional regulator with XRE-family HTH domain
LGRHPSRRHVAPDEAPIGRRIRQRRRELGLTQSGLGGFDYTKSFISQLESGDADPSLDTLRFLSRRLQTSLSSLAGDGSDQYLAAVEGLLVWGREAARTRNGSLAHQVLRIATDLADASGWDLQRVESRLLLAELEIHRGDMTAAAALLSTTKHLAAGLGPRVVARQDLASGLLALRRGDDAAALVSFRAVLDGLKKTTRHPDLAIQALLGLADALSRAGDVKDAGRKLAAALRLAARYRIPELQGRALLRLGLLRRQEGAAAEAVRQLQEAEAILDGTDDREAHFEALIHRGHILLDEDDAAGALEVSRRATTLARDRRDASAQARAYCLAGRALLRQGHADEGVPMLMSGIEGLLAVDAVQELAGAAHDLSQYHRARGDHEQAARYETIAVKTRTGAPESRAAEPSPAPSEAV